MPRASRCHRTEAQPGVIPPPLLAELERHLAGVRGAGTAIVAARPASGGCINESAILVLQDGASAFVKWNRASPYGMFAREAEALGEMASVGAVRVPRVYSFSDEPHGDCPAHILMEDVTRPASANAPRVANPMEHLGRGLAVMHRTVTPRYGAAADNFIGPTPQPNGWADDWAEFFREKRILHMVGLLDSSGRLSPSDRLLAERFMSRLPGLLCTADAVPSFLHGDLWGGNVLVDEAGYPSLIDPASYHGHREADLAMTELFGGFGPRFLAAYSEAWPLDAAYPERRDIYNLYHLLNHALLFGGGYLAQATGVMRRFV
jgi:protein-ribulosamine 3-kinase